MSYICHVRILIKMNVFTRIYWVKGYIRSEQFPVVSKDLPLQPVLMYCVYERV